ncbi:hypothetical protein [Micromonospora sp. WMMD1082]|uniref:hypothetical protein n=1 Tax=Micromonospora sp. WMMD1082 TaxID=3016104 RepID=UPI002416EAE5|nr:hypothetical protein [Micromonospora sp. WMMD1082]MDG4795216.1 hypothetical protein [Micromonospora sp. WMMD1082]
MEPESRSGGGPDPQAADAPAAAAAKADHAGAGSWSDALVLGGDLARLSVPWGTAASWDWVATRGIIAVALHAVACRDEVPVAAVPLGQLIVPLLDEDRFVTLVTTVLAAQLGDAANPVSAQWAWLRRPWDPDAPPGKRWDGLTRGIGRGLRDPAVDVCLLWAGAAVEQAMLNERGGLHRGTRVTVSGGEHGGRVGVVEGAAWQVDPPGTAVVAGPPDAYMINFGAELGYRPVRVPAEYLEAAERSAT